MHRGRPPVDAPPAAEELDVAVRAVPIESDRVLTFLADAAGRLLGADDLDSVASLTVEVAVPTLATCAVLVLPDVRGRLDWWRWSRRGRCTRGRIRRPSAESAPALSAALDGLKLIDDLTTAELAALPRAFAEPLTRYDEVSVISLPAVEAGEPPGALVLGRREAAVTLFDAQVMIEFAERASRAVATARRFDRLREAAQELQSTLRPAALPVLPGIRMAAIYRPAAGPIDVGGDFYDIHLQPDGSALFTLGDVCGNGPEAAALSGRVRHAIAALRLVEGDPERLLHLVNRALLGMGGSAKFATAVVGSISRRSGGSLLLRMSSGGHPAPVVLRRDGTVESVAVPGMLIGIMPNVQLGEATVELAPQDICVLYTDGITEARGGDGREELFGSERLRAVLADCAGLPVEKVAARVDQAVQRWSNGDSRDDIALLAIQSVPGQ